MCISLLRKQSTGGCGINPRHSDRHFDATPLRVQLDRNRNRNKMYKLVEFHSINSFLWKKP